MQDTSKTTTDREYFFSIDLRGNLVHDGAIVEDQRFLHRFFQALRVNTSGLHPDFPFVSPCGPEWNYLRCADTPLVFQALDGNRLFYAPECSVEYNPRELRFGENGVLYHAAPVGDVGRIHQSVLSGMTATIHRWGPWFSIDCSSGEYPYHEVIEPLVTPPHLRVLRPRDGNQCVGCGRDSATGLKLSFLFDSSLNEVRCWFTPDHRLMGSLNIMHGGFVALLLDETMGKILGANMIKAPTAQLDVRYRRPVPIGEELELWAKLDSVDGRKHRLQGSVRRAAEPDVVLAEAQALFIRLPQHNADAPQNVSTTK